MKNILHNGNDISDQIRFVCKIHLLSRLCVSAFSCLSGVRFVMDVPERGKVMIMRRRYCTHMSVREAIRTKESGAEVDVIVSPRSNRSGVEGTDEWRNRLVIRVKAPPLDGKANKEVEEVLSEIVGCKATVISGHTNRQKTVFISGDPEKIVSAFEKIK